MQRAARLMICFVIMRTSSLLYEWREPWRYYFTSLQSKMKETLSPKCLANLIEQPDLSFPTENHLIYATTVVVDDAIRRWWRSILPPAQMRVEPFLCDTVAQKKLPIFNNTGCQLQSYMNPSAPRCQTKYLKWICDSARMTIDNEQSNNFILPESNHSDSNYPPNSWILTVQNSFVSRCGHIVSKCGIIRTTANCMANGLKFQGNQFEKSCPLSLATNRVFQAGDNLTCNAGAPWTAHVEYHDRVFVVAETDDTYVYHIHLEIMPRIIYHLKFLKNNPDVKILIGCDTKSDSKRTLAGIRHGLLSMQPLMTLVGLPMSRLVVHRHVYARQVLLPMEGGCQDPVYNTWQILTMRKLFLQMIHVDPFYLPPVQPGRQTTYRNDKTIGTENTKFATEESPAISPIATATLSTTNVKPLMLLLKRTAGAKHTRNGFDSVRQWSNAFTERIMDQLVTAFGNAYHVKLFNDRNETLMGCFACQVEQFAETDVLVGMHGAGLANMVYMRPNGAVVELGPYGNDGRCLLGGGPFSRMAAVMAHNYMIHHPPFEEYKWIKSDMSSEFNITRFVIHIKSFLLSASKL